MVDERTHSREHRLQRREMNKTETVQTFALDEFWSSNTFKGASLWPPVAFLKVDTRKRLESMEPAYAANPLMPLPPPTLLLLLATSTAATAAAAASDSLPLVPAALRGAR